jgi:hypothetical protein
MVDLETGLRRGEIEVLAEFDVGSPARHVRGDHDGGLLAGARDDLSLSLVVLGVEDFVL